MISIHHYFAAVCLRVQEIMPVFSSSEIEMLWQRWLAEEGENRSNRYTLVIPEGHEWGLEG